MYTLWFPVCSVLVSCTLFYMLSYVRQRLICHLKETHSNFLLFFVFFNKLSNSRQEVNQAHVMFYSPSPVLILQTPSFPSPSRSSSCCWNTWSVWCLAMSAVWGWLWWKDKPSRRRGSPVRWRSSRPLSLCSSTTRLWMKRRVKLRQCRTDGFYKVKTK